MSDQLRKYIAEFIGTAILVFVGSMAILSDGADTVVVAFAFGLGLLIALFSVGEVSGGHFNPAVTLGAFLDGRINLTDGIGYWVSQVAGAVVASLGVWWASSRAAVAATATVPGSHVGDGTVFLVETALTAAFVMVVLKVTAGGGSGMGSGVISFAFTGAYLAALHISGASVNPARSIGPALVGNNAGDLWLYLLAPLAGAIIGWIIYQVVNRGMVEMDVDTD